MPKKKKILFVCVGNSCRSQMAEGFMRFYGTDLVEVQSAGTSASGVVHQDAIKAMKGSGIDISRQTSKQLTPDMLQWADIVITTGCCPAKELSPIGYKGETYDWDISDPLGMPQEVMIKVRDDIESRVKELLANIKNKCR